MNLLQKKYYLISIDAADRASRLAQYNPQAALDSFLVHLDRKKSKLIANAKTLNPQIKQTINRINTELQVRRNARTNDEFPEIPTEAQKHEGIPKVENDQEVDPVILHAQDNADIEEVGNNIANGQNINTHQNINNVDIEELQNNINNGQNNDQNNFFTNRLNNAQNAVLANVDVKTGELRHILESLPSDSPLVVNHDGFMYLNGRPIGHRERHITHMRNLLLSGSRSKPPRNSLLPGSRSKPRSKPPQYFRDFMRFLTQYDFNLNTSRRQLRNVPTRQSGFRYGAGKNLRFRDIPLLS